ncbi:MAG TPA: DNA (cytosine-5-)-methyltransferase [Planctomycetales bacterium]|jgi:DNA (cytosine-5)-methyltransferase 1|nr:DNA (cytosine-5-)-methyltransferase [Planctomycetales bacterium]
MRPIAIDLFSGCGGLTLGLKQAGFRVIGAVDNDPLSVETYKLNHRNMVVWDQDIETLKVRVVKRGLGIRKGELDLLAGCPPCQGFSTMRTLNGAYPVDDPRNDLVFEFLKFVRGLLPKAVMMENVPGLASDGRMEYFCEELRRLGYDYEFRVLNAARYGVPQRRRRMILLAGRFGSVPFAPQAECVRTVRDAIKGLPPPGCSGDGLHDLGEARTSRIVELIRKIPKDGGSREDLGPGAQLACHQTFDGFKDVYGRMAWDAPAPTITGGFVNPSKGRFLHPEQDRTITLREAALLQSFPPKYRISLRRGKFPAALLIGNALPPEFVKRHAQEVRIYLRQAAGSRVRRSRGADHANNR